MDGVEWHRQWLGPGESWTMERVEVDAALKHVDVLLETRRGSSRSAPSAGRDLGIYDRLTERVWGVSGQLCQFITYLHARPARVSSPEHGVRQLALPWAQAGSRFTNLLEALAINVLRAANVQKVAVIPCLTRNEAWHLIERAVIQGRTV